MRLQDSVMTRGNYGTQAERYWTALRASINDLARLRRKFDPTSNYLETKAQMERVMDSARRVNQVVGGLIQIVHCVVQFILCLLRLILASLCQHLISLG